MQRVVGIDVASDAAWLVALDADLALPRVIGADLIAPVAGSAIERFCRGAAIVAVDAPSGYSELPHLEDERLAPKFRRACCGEVALHRSGISVPWVSPSRDETPAGWVTTGVEIWSMLRAIEIPAIETYPHGVIWRLAGRPLNHKSRPTGHLARLELLRRHVAVPSAAELWSHDSLDALAAALVAALALSGEAYGLSCANDTGWVVHDGSSIWLPRG